jgi:RNA polymerase sigma-70 factor (ECF subfamily)
VDESANFEELIAGLRTGDPAAAEALCRRYGPFIRAAVRRQLHPRMRNRFDSLDFVQDVWASFLAIPSDRYVFTNPESLVAFLARMAQYRVVEAFRQRFDSEKDGLAREVAVDETLGGDHLPGRQATPSQFAIAGEEWERIAGRFPAGHRVILEWLREGHSNDEVARLANVSVSTVNRIVRRLKDLTGV